ncbi:oleate hydratase [Vagococcus sp.]|uniref:oleate hydratase n=1 Tax=Vagococcus sp. TaxID=1933889 RepID=UPI003F9C8042
MEYSNGNYEAFARPTISEKNKQKKAYLVGASLASLAAATFLIRDGKMKGKNIHIFENTDVSGGSLDGRDIHNHGYIIRFEQQLNPRSECLWDLYRSIPSLEIKDASVLDEIYWLNKKEPNVSLTRVIENSGLNAHPETQLILTQQASKEIYDLFIATEVSLQDKAIYDVFSKDFFHSNFWLLWKSQFTFEKWHSALEMRRYLRRFIQDIGQLTDMTQLKSTKYNQYESLILPIVAYLKNQGVQFSYQTTVKNIIVESTGTEKLAKEMILLEKDKTKQIQLSKNDLVFVTNGSIVESSTMGTHHEFAILNDSIGPSFSLWKNMAEQDQAFGNPEKFYNHINESHFVSATLTTLDDLIPPYLEDISHRKVLSGSAVTGGLVTIKDSAWLMSYSISRQPHFKQQADQQSTIWLYGLLTDKPGNFIPKPMRACTGEEITQEWLYHIGVPEDEIKDIAKNSARTIPVMLPFATAAFLPRAIEDRPKVVPKDYQNLAFLGNFVETPIDATSTSEYSVRTAMEAVYTLLGVDRSVPEVFDSAFDLRILLQATSLLLDDKKISELHSPFFIKYLEKKEQKKIKDTNLYQLLKTNHLID